MSQDWTTQSAPIIGLSPMDGVTDHPFRHIQKRYGNPDLLFTEFVRVERLLGGEVKLLRDLLYDESQRPIVAQVYGTTPAAFRQVAVLLCRLGFDGIDINMGCPTKSVADSGAGAGLICTPPLAKAIVAAVEAGIADWQAGATAWDLPDVAPAIAAQVEAHHAQLPRQFQACRALPASVKTRIGYDQSQIETWIPHLLDAGPAAITIHGRTLVQGYGGQADWESIGRAAELAKGSNTKILGNGDVPDRETALSRVQAYGVDGVLIGRGSYGNPFVFRNQATKNENLPELYPRLFLARHHATLFEENLSAWPGYSFHDMHKHLGWYARQMPGARGLRQALLHTTCAAEVDQAIDDYLAYRARWDKFD